jgi:SecY interacting protein Syd
VHDVATALGNFVDRYVAAYPELLEPFDPDWRSPCERGEPFVGPSGTTLVRWRPVRRPPFEREDGAFAGLERALAVPIHPDIKAYYGSYWSGGLEATAADGHVSLILLWNRDDADRLIENLIGHSLAKRRVRSHFTVFFACTEPESDLFLAIDNATGAVMLERPGYKPLRQVAGSLAEFLTGLEPAPPHLHPERRAI